MGIDIHAPKESGWDAADAKAAGWTTADTLAWAKPIAKLYVPGADDKGVGQDDTPEPPPIDDVGTTDATPAALTPPPEPPADLKWPFRVLGYNRGAFFYLPKGAPQIVNLSASAHRSENLMGLADLSFWEINFPGKQGADWKAAANALMRAAQRAGIFTTHNRIRGRGAWLDKGRSVFHVGDFLSVDGAIVFLNAMDSRFVYEEDESLNVTPEPAVAGRDAVRVLDICKDLRWEHPMSGYLLAGWLVMAPLCGILPWRPHLWITGPSGSGKTTVMREIVSRVIGRFAARVVGNTTEAALRGLLRYDARPVIFDEVEPKDNYNQQRIRAIIDLARVAASEADGMVYKGTRDQGVNGYPIRSMFCFGSINPGLESFADESRFTQLALVGNDPKDEEEKAIAQAHYEQLMQTITETFTDRFVNGLLFRSLDNLATLKENVDTFTTAAASHLGNRRLGDQMGPMLAGCYLLHSTAKISFSDALAWIKKREWDQHSAGSAVRDHDRLLQLIMQHQVRFQAGNSGQTERSVGELVAAGIGTDLDSSINPHGAKEALLRIGIRAEAGGLFISTTHNYLKKVLQGTEWGMSWRRGLLAIGGAVPGNKGKNVRFGPGVSTPAIWIPLAVAMGEGG